MAEERSHDLVLYGATGFTGKLVAEYLAEHAPDSLRWAIAGRNPEKLEGVRADLAATWPRVADLPIEKADGDDRPSLDRLARGARVVCSTVGPYAKYGSGLVAACVEAATDYCDLTGEVQWIRRMIDAHHERAKATGARIVHCCGFDSIPSDIGTFMLGEAMAARGGRIRQVKLFAGETRGGFSGGTIASLIGVLEEVGRDRSVLRVIGNPYALNPEGEREGPDGQDQRGVVFDEDLGMWTAPFVMAAVNTRIVRRSNALRGYPYGRDFRYSEVMSTGRGPAGLARASTVAAGLAGFIAAASVKPVRQVLENRFLPAPGEGPDAEARERGFFVMRLVGKGTGPDGAELELRGRVEGRKDPGYGETAKMLGESAMCLALDGDRLTTEGGVMTPSVAMGAAVLDRLRAAGMVFQVEGTG